MKKGISYLFSLVLGALLTLCCVEAGAQPTAITVTSIRSAKGQLIINVFRDSEGYEAERPFEQFVFSKAKLVNGTIRLTCPLPAGVYGITLTDDENTNNVLDKNMIGKPKEGFGFSNFFLEKMRKPSYDDFKVELNIGSAKAVVIKVKYM